MIGKESVGLELSERKLTIAYAKAASFATKVCAHAEYELSAAAESSERTDEICAIVKEFWREYRVRDACIWIGLPAAMVMQRVIHLPLIAKENLGKAIEYELQKFMPLELEDIYFRHQVLHEDRSARKLSILVIAVKKNDLAPIIELRHHLDTGIYGAEPVTTAGLNWIKHSAAITSGKNYCLAYAADGSLHLSYFSSDQLLYVSSLPLAGDLVSRSEQMFKELEAVGAINSLDAAEPDLSVYCCGPDATEDTLRRLNGLPMMKFVYFEEEDGLMPNAHAIPSTGLALKGLHQVALNINLFPEQFRKKPSVAGRYLVLALLVLACIGGLAWAGSLFIRPMVLNAQVDKELAEISDEIEALSLVQTEIGRLEEQINYLNSLRQQRMSTLDFLKELTDILPDTAWLRSLTVAGERIAIEGAADSSTELVPQLEASPLFVNTEFISTITKTRDGKDLFKIGFEFDLQ